MKCPQCHHEFFPYPRRSEKLNRCVKELAAGLLATFTDCQIVQGREVWNVIRSVARMAGRGAWEYQGARQYLQHAGALYHPGPERLRWAIKAEMMQLLAEEGLILEVEGTA